MQHNIPNNEAIKLNLKFYVQKLKKNTTKYHWTMKEIQGKLLNTYGVNDNESTTCQILWLMFKAVLRGKCVPLNVVKIKKECKQESYAFNLQS